MATRKVVARKKPASASSSRPVKQTRVVPDALISGEANDELLESKGAVKPGKPKIHAKVISFTVSVGTDDRGRSFEKFVEDIKKKLGAVPTTDGKGNRRNGLHVTATGGYYILDGKVCRPEDYDPKTGTFKKGATPPTWAGGPKHNPQVGMQNQIQYDLQHLSSDEYDKKYQINKYKPKNEGKIITPAMQKQKREAWQEEKARKQDEGLEEFDWDESDVSDDSKLSAASDRSASRAIRRVKATKKSASPKKRVVKKAATPTPKKTVRRVKK